MKKLLTGILAVLTCCTCFAATACDIPFFGDKQPTTSEQPATSDLEGAKEALYGMYISKDVETSKDYEVVNTCLYDGVYYNVSWSVDVTEGVVVTAGSEGMTKIDIDQTISENVAYVLTATISDAEGNTITVSFERTALAVNLVPEAITATPVEDVAYKFYVYQTNKKADLYFAGNMDGFYYKTTQVLEEAVDLFVEYKEGSTTEFYLYFEHAADGKQYIGAQEGWNSKNSYWTVNVVYNSNPPSAFVYDAELGTITTTIPCRSDADKNNQNAEQTATKTVYFGNYSTHMTISASTLDKAATSNVGVLVKMIDKNNVPAEDKIAVVKEGVSVQLNHKVDKEIELTTSDERYPDVAISWSVAASEYASIADNKLSLAIPATEATVVLTATFTCKGVTDTKEFTLTLGPKVVSPAADATAADIVNAAFSLAENEALDGTYTLTGVISKVNTAYSADYSNVTVTITVEDKAIECYRLKGEGADVIKVGDTITVSGKIKNYNGKVEFDSGCTLDSYVVNEGQGGEGGDDVGGGEGGETTDNMTITEALAAAEGTAVVLTGTVDQFYYTYNSQYDNVSVYIKDATGARILAFRLKGGSDMVIGDVIQVTGVTTLFSNKIQIAEGCTYVVVTKHVCADFTPANCKTPATCKVCGATTGEVSSTHSYASGVCSVCGAQEPGSTVEAQTVKVTMANKGYANAEAVSSLSIGDVSVSFENSTASTKYYNSGTSLRLYTTTNSTTTVTFTATNATIVSIKITYTKDNDGVLSYGSETITSDQVVSVNSDTAVFTVTDESGSSSWGQIRISAIEVIYVPNN